MDAQLIRCVVAISDVGTKAVLGSGFIASADGAVLTAAHVVGTRATVNVRSRDAAWVEVKVTARDAAADWAVIDLGVAHVPMPCGVLPPDVDVGKLRWVATGFPNLMANQEATVVGELRAPIAGGFDLRCEELVDAKHGDAAGLSGAALVVEGEAIGIITNVVRDREGAIVIASVRAILLPALPRIPIAGTARVPWEELFRDAFAACARGLQQTAATSAGMPTVIATERLPVQLARHVSHGGVEVVAAAVAQLCAAWSEPTLDVVLDASCSLWVDAKAVAQLAGAIANSNATATLCTERDWVADHHVARVFTAQFPGRSTWRVVHVPREDGTAATVDAVGRALKAALKRSPEKIRELLGKPQQRVVAAIAGPPSAELADAVRAAWPELRVVFLFRGAVAGAIRPAATVAEELAQDETNAAACSDARGGR